MNFYCRVREQLKNGDIVVAGDQWPLLVYADYEYNLEEPWEGLFRSKLLVWVRFLILLYSFFSPENLILIPLFCKAYKHIFTSPSSVEKEAKATRSGNARIHGMTRVTPASLAYVATQVCSYMNHEGYTDISYLAMIHVVICLRLLPVRHSD